MTALVKCPVCSLEWDDPNCEQAICIELYDECIPCRFSPSHPHGSNTDDQEGMDAIMKVWRERNHNDG